MEIIFPWPSSAISFFFKKNRSWPIDAIAYNALGSCCFLQQMVPNQIRNGD